MHRTPRRWLAALTVGITAITLAVASPPEPVRAGSSVPVLQVLVLGDSYSAGNGAGSYYGPAACWRSRHNYAERFAAAVRGGPGNPQVSVTTKACSGARTEDFFQPRNNRPAQLHWVTQGDDLVLLTIGANDAHIAGIVYFCLIPDVRVARKCAAKLSRAEELVRDGQLGRRITRVLNAIRSRAGGRAKIVLLGYPFLEGDQGYTLHRAQGGPVRVGARLHALNLAVDAVARAAVRATNNAYPHARRAIFESVLSLFNGPPFHGLYATRVNPSRWLVQPYLDAHLALAQTFYHPLPIGWSNYAGLLLHDARVPQTP